MKAVVQRVKESSVTVEGKIVGKIGPGLLVLLGIAKGDTIQDIDFISDKIINLRIFEDEKSKMNRSILDTGGELLVVSQFTLLGDCSRGRRPSFTDAAEPEKANHFYELFVEKVRSNGVRVETGVFRAYMDVSLINDGPVTLIVESK